MQKNNSHNSEFSNVQKLHITFFVPVGGLRRGYTEYMNSISVIRVYPILSLL